jgi:hypothetical protein
MLAGRAAVALPEALEQVGRDLRAEADPVVANGQNHLIAVDAEPHLDATAVGSELDCIRREIPYNLP